MVIADFRADFPEFSDVSKYPDAQINFYAALAEKMLRLDIWGDTRPFGVKLYVAHEIALAAVNKQAASVGGTPGQFGVTSSKAVGAVSTSYDTAAGTEKDAGWWNLTTYGRQLYRLIKVFGAGCVQL